MQIPVGQQEITRIFSTTHRHCVAQCLAPVALVDKQLLFPIGVGWGIWSQGGSGLTRNHSPMGTVSRRMLLLPVFPGMTQPLSPVGHRWRASPFSAQTTKGRVPFLPQCALLLKPLLGRCACLSHAWPRAGIDSSLTHGRHQPPVFVLHVPLTSAWCIAGGKVEGGAHTHAHTQTYTLVAYTHTHTIAGQMGTTQVKPGQTRSRRVSSDQAVPVTTVRKSTQLGAV